MIFRPHPKTPKREKSVASPLRRRSKKMAARYAGTTEVEGRRDFVARILAERPECEAGLKIGMEIARELTGGGPFVAGIRTYRSFAGCTVASVDVHEVLARSAGGSILDPKNVLALCRSCHEWIGNNPAAAHRIRLRASRYPGRNQ